MDGIAKAKERGVRFGQQKRLTAQQVAELQARRKEGELIRELMAGYGLSKATVYGYLNQEIDSATYLPPNIHLRPLTFLVLISQVSVTPISPVQIL